MGGFEAFEHTADVGIRAWGATLEECFQQATLGLLDITGASATGEGSRTEVTVEGRDLGSVLVDWLSEVLYLQDARDAVITGFEVAHVDDNSASGWIALRPRDEPLTGTAVKAITYHGLSVERGDDAWKAELVVDV
ncbi:MAG: archease [Actinomycetota bacterium]